MTLIDGPDCSLWVEIHGHGDPVTVFAHGITGSTGDLAPLASRTPGTRVLFDFRGHGHSDCPPEDAGYDGAAMLRDAEFVADRYAATHAFGISMGAGAILSMLAREPERFERVALFIPSADDRARPAGASPALADELERLSLDEVAERAIASPAYAALVARRPYWSDVLRDRFRRMNSTGVPRALRAYAAGAAPAFDATALARVRAPVLLLAHEGDPLHDARAARRLASLLPASRLEVWPELLAMYDDLDGFARLIGDFLGA